MNVSNNNLVVRRSSEFLKEIYRDIFFLYVLVSFFS